MPPVDGVVVALTTKRDFPWLQTWPQNLVHDSRWIWSKPHDLRKRVEQVQRLLNPLSDPETRLDLERLHGVVAGQGASWLADGPRLPTPRQRQVHLSEESQRELVAAYMAGDAVGNLASAYQLHRGTVSEILTRHGVIGRSHGPRPGANFG